MDPDIPLYSNSVAKLVLFFVVQTNLDFRNKKNQTNLCETVQSRIFSFNICTYFQLTFIDSHSVSESDPLSSTEVLRFKMFIIKFPVQGECRCKVSGSISLGNHPSYNPSPSYTHIVQ